MDWWMVVVGVVVLVGVVVDALTATLSPSTRSGSLTGGITAAVWSAISRAGDAGRMAAGPVILVVTAGTWLLLLWLGWTLVFSADPEAVVETATRQPADLSGRVFFTAYTLFTLGLGNYVPTGWWEIVAAFALLNGLGLATLAVTFLLTVVTAVTERRRQAAFIAALGDGPAGIVANNAPGHFRTVAAALPSLSSGLVLTAQRQLTYPVMHYFRGADERSALPVQVAALDDALTLIQAAEHPIDPGLVTLYRRSLDSLLDLRAADDPEVEDPPPPVVAPLDALGIGYDPVLLEQDLQRNTARRRRLHAYLRGTGWEWPSTSP